MRILAVFIFSLTSHALASGEVVCRVEPGAAALKDPAHRLPEISGVETHGDLLWVHNDSGDSPRIFAVRGGDIVAEVSVSGAHAVDWEDIARGGGALWIGDIGNNNYNRKDLAIIKIPEPTALVSRMVVSGQSFTFSFPDGAYNSEALGYRNGRLYLITKGSNTLYAFPETMAQNMVLAKLCRFTFPDLVTGMDISDDGEWMAVRTYSMVYEFPFGHCDTPRLAMGHREPQGEAIGYYTGGFVTLSEGLSPTINRITCGPAPVDDLHCPIYREIAGCELAAFKTKCPATCR